MGAWNMGFVMDHLKGVDVTIDNWTPKNGKARKRHLDTFDLALLMTIAHRQRDEAPEKGIPDEVCVCYGGEEKIAGLARMGTTKLEECRNFLKANHLITYTISAPCPEYLRAKVKKTTLDYVWKLNKPRFLQLKKSGGDTVESPPHGVDEPATRENQPRHAGTKRTYTKKTTNSSMSSSASAADLKLANTERAELYKRLIVNTYRLSPEQASFIGIEGVIAGTYDKQPDDVRKAIEQFGHTDMLDRKFGKWAGMLINKLKELDGVADPTTIPPAKELDAQFSQPQKSAAETDAFERKKKIAQEGLNTLYKELGLRELPKERRDEIRAAYDKALNSRWCEMEDVVRKILSDACYIPGKPNSFEDLRRIMPDVNDRANKLMEVIKSVTLT